MRLPFQLKKTYTTEYSQEEVIEFVRKRLNRKRNVLFMPWKEYVGSITEKSFDFYKNFNGRIGHKNPKISGTITSTNPTTINIKISPFYIRVFFFLIFPILFIPVAIFNEQIVINGVLGAPKIFGKITFMLLGCCIPIIWCYMDSIRPIKRTERWLKTGLGLIEMKQKLPRS